jgi:hypothetical protein
MLGKKRPRPQKITVNDMDQHINWQKINHSYALKHEVTTPKKLLSNLFQKKHFNFQSGKEMLRNIINETGFCFKKYKNSRSTTMEQNFTGWEAHYLRAITKYYS